MIVPVYGDDEKYIKTKIKIYGASVNKNVQDKKIPKEKVAFNCLPIIMVDSAIKARKKYYPQTLLEEYKIWTEKDKNWKSCWWWFRKTFVW